MINTFPVLNGVILFLGSLLVIYMGFTLLIRSSPQVENDVDLVSDSVLKIIGICFAITWFNPQAIIDGTLLLGGVNASLPHSMATYFILGVCIASCLWFFIISEHKLYNCAPK